MSVILMYHRVADLPIDPYGLAVHPARFAAHVEHLSRLGSTVPLTEAVGPGSRRRIALTFDDGYVDNATQAAPLVSDAALPATWFITAGRLGRRRYWWDRLAEALLGTHPLPPSVDVEIAGSAIWLDLRTPSARTTALHFLHRRLRPLAPQLVEISVDRVIGILGAPLPRNGDLTMTTDDLRHLAALPLQEIGAHTLTHVQLQDQPLELQRTEILGSVAELGELLHRPIEAFAYPFGVPDAVGPLAPRLVEESGCRLACTTDPGSVGRRTDRYRLPRLYVKDWDGPEFAARLHAATTDRVAL